MEHVEEVLEEQQEQELQKHKEEELEEESDKELEQLLCSTACSPVTEPAPFMGLQPSAERGDTMNNRSSGPSVC